jgi:hypothetical protein
MQQALPADFLSAAIQDDDLHRQGGFCHEAGFVLGQGTKPTLVIGP